MKNYQVSQLLKNKYVYSFVLIILSLLILKVLRWNLYSFAPILKAIIYAFILYFSLYLLYKGLGFLISGHCFEKFVVFGFTASVLLTLYLFVHIPLVMLSDPIKYVLQLLFVAHGTIVLFFFGFLAYLSKPETSISILFLRKFGNTSLNKDIKSAIEKTNRKDLRLVTLDDSNFIPSGSELRPLFTLFALGAALLSLIAGYYSIIQTNFSILFGVSEGQLYGESMLGYLQLIITIILICLFIAISTLFVFQAKSMIMKNVKLVTDKDYSERISHITPPEGFSNRAMNLSTPISRVVGTSDNLWMQVVKLLSQKNDIVIMEISEYSESIKWEVELLSQNFSEKTIFLKNSKIQLSDRFTSDIKVSSYESSIELKNQLEEQINKIRVKTISIDLIKEKINLFLDKFAIYGVPSFAICLFFPVFVEVVYQMVSYSNNHGLWILIVMLIAGPLLISAFAFFINYIFSHMERMRDFVRRLLVIISTLLVFYIPIVFLTFAHY